MGVNEKGQILISNYEGRTEKVPDIDKAIRQQVLYIPMSYRNAIATFADSLSVQHIGKTNELADVIIRIDELSSILKGLGDKTVLENNIQSLQKDFEQLKTILPEIIQKQLKIVFWVQKRGLALIEEKERCENIINKSVETLALVYKYLSENNLKLIYWPDVFKALSALNTIKVNPYKERTKDRTVQILKGKGRNGKRVFDLVNAGEVKLAKRRVWKTFLKLLPIYSSVMELDINGTTFLIEKGSIKIQQ